MALDYFVLHGEIIHENLKKKMKQNLLIVKALNGANIGTDNGNLGGGVGPLHQKRLRV